MKLLFLWVEFAVGKDDFFPFILYKQVSSLIFDIMLLNPTGKSGCLNTITTCKCNITQISDSTRMCSLESEHSFCCVKFLNFAFPCFVTANRIVMWLEFTIVKVIICP